MPKKGYKSITVTDKVFTVLQNIADGNDRSIPGEIQAMLVKCYPEVVQLLKTKEGEV